VNARHLAALVALAGCSDPLVPPWLIDKPRVLGARVEAAGDPTRPWPRPGETASITWMLVAPGVPVMRWAFTVCAAGADDACTAPVTNVSGDGMPPALSFAVPPAETLGASDHLLVAGGFCADGQPALSGQTPVCTGGTEAPLAVTLPVTIARDATDNHNPAMSAAAFTLAGAPWPDGDACNGGMRVAADGAKRAITVAVPLAERDPFTSTANPTNTPMLVREAIQLSHFATAGKLERQISFVESGDLRDPAAISVDWTPPPATEVPAGGLPVHFYFVARDLRGGADWLTKSLCVVPPSPPQP
jgi:hypothetical protein